MSLTRRDEAPLTRFTPPEPRRSLSPQQEAIAKCLARGLSVKRIASVVGCSETNVVYHIGQIDAALNLPDNDDDEFSPRERVMVWAFWVYRAA